MTHIALIYQSNHQQVARTLRAVVEGLSPDRLALVVVEIADGLGGIQTDYFPDHEHIRVGRPPTVDDQFFDFLKPARGDNTALSVMLARLLYNRSCHHLHLCETNLLGAAKHAIGNLDTRIGWADKHRTSRWATRRFIEKQYRRYPLINRVASDSQEASCQT